MKYLYLFLCSISILLFENCKKEKTIEAPQTLQIAPDSIEYYDIIPDTTITSVQYYTPWGGTVPSDSSCSLVFDIDSDSTVDFSLSIGHYYHWVSNSNPQANYNYVMSVYSPDSTCRFTRTSYYGPNVLANFIPYATIIDTSLLYNNYVTLFANQPYMMGYGNYSVLGDNYVGFEFSKNNSKYFGWILVTIQHFNLTLRSWAINKTANNTIFAGQTN